MLIEELLQIEMKTLGKKISDFWRQGDSGSTLLVMAMWALWWGMVIFQQREKPGYADVVADVAYPFVDIQRADIRVNDSDISATIDLFSLAPKPTYNNPALRDNALEYNFAVYFDIDGDNTPANDVGLSISSFKYPGSKPGQGRVLTFAQKSLFRADESGKSFQYIADINASQRGSSLRVSVAKETHSLLADISETTPLRVFAYYNNGVVPVMDFLPDDGGYITPAD